MKVQEAITVHARLRRAREKVTVLQIVHRESRMISAFCRWSLRLLNPLEARFAREIERAIRNAQGEER
jgi:hypothetical protein